MNPDITKSCSMIQHRMNPHIIKQKHNKTLQKKRQTKYTPKGETHKHPKKLDFIEKKSAKMKDTKGLGLSSEEKKDQWQPLN